MAGDSEALLGTEEDSEAAPTEVIMYSLTIVSRVLLMFLIYVSFMGCIVSDFCLPTSWIFPDDPATGESREGICSLVHTKDGSPVTYTSSAGRDEVVFSFNGTNYSDFSNVPESCQVIDKTDIVNSTTGPDCDAFCLPAMGWSLHFGCTFISGMLGDPTKLMFKACSKVRLWEQLSWLPQWGVYAFILVYGFIGVAIVYCSYRAGIRIQLIQSTRNPREDGCAEDGPYKNKKYGMPFSCFSTKSDMDASRCALKQTFLSTLAKPLTEMNTMLNYAKTGRPIYFLIVLTQWCLLHLPYCDFFATLELQAVAASFQQGYPNWMMIKLQASTELPVRFSTWVNVLAVLCYSGSLFQVAAPLLSIFLALASTLPSASSARILQQKCGPNVAHVWEHEGAVGPQTLTDFYKIQEMKTKISMKKYGSSCETLTMSTLLGFCLKFRSTKGLWDFFGIPCIGYVVFNFGAACYLSTIDKDSSGVTDEDEDPETSLYRIRRFFETYWIWVSPSLWAYLVWADMSEVQQLFSDVPHDPMALVNAGFFIAGVFSSIGACVLWLSNPFKTEEESDDDEDEDEFDSEDDDDSLACLSR